MVFGLFLICSGILIALFPPLLAIIIAMLLITTGVVLTAISYRYKKLKKDFNDPFVDFFIKF